MVNESEEALNIIDADSGGAGQVQVRSRSGLGQVQVRSRLILIQV